MYSYVWRQESALTGTTCKRELFQRRTKLKRMLINLIPAITALFIVLVYLFLWRSRKQKALESFTQWLIFSVTLALTPLIFNAILILFMEDIPFNMVTVLSKGELLIVSVAIGSEASGRLIASGTSYKSLKIASAGASFLLVIISSLLYAVISRPVGLSLDSNSVSLGSIVIFLMTIMSSLSCVLLAEG